MNNYYKIDMIDVGESSDGNFALILKSGSSRILVMSIGYSEAHSIKLELIGEKYQRPLTHDLIKTLLLAFKSSVDRVLITHLDNSVFFAVMRVISKDNSKIIDIDCRPSDAVAIALRLDAPIFINENLLSIIEPPPKET